jgi:hypothetical protein
MRIGLLVEGGIDEEILPPLINQLLADWRRHRRREPDYYRFPFPPKGYGEILKNVRMLVKLYPNAEEWQRIGCDLFVVVLDSRNTETVQREITRVLKGATGFPAVFGLAVQETEAWVLGDIDHVNRHVFKVKPQPRLQTSPEKDPDPKRTLNDFYVRASTAIDYDAWNKECARAVAPYLRGSQVEVRCPKGFGKLAERFRQTVRGIK